jgi:cell division protein FtsW
MSQETDRLPLRYNATGQGLLLSSLALLALGVVMVHSAVASVADPGFAWYNRTDVRHTIFATVSALILYTLWLIDYRKLARGPWMPLVPGLILLLGLATGAAILIPSIGRAIGGFAVGGKIRWIRWGPFQFQPSEIIKLALVLFLAAWLTRPEVKTRSFWKVFLPSVLLIGLGIAVTYKNDFGAAVIIAVCAWVTLLFAGVPLYYLLPLIPAAGYVGYKVIMAKPDHVSRIAAAFNPWLIENSSAYQPRESLLAILTGGWMGKGLGNGEIKLGSLPEDSTDFIFAVFCEEWGLIGALLLMGLLVVWIWHSRRAAVRAPDRFGRVLAGSMGFLVIVQAVMHIAVNLVIAPPTGVTLPFISAGGTALLLTAAGVALMVSVTSRRAAGDYPAVESPAEARVAAASGR